MKKMLSFMLAIVMVFSLLPTAVFAAEVPSMHFETTFTEEKGVGDTFTVTYYIDSNPGFNSFCFPLSWNENVVEFNGFNEVFDEDNEEDVLETTALSAFSLAYDHDYGIVTGARANDVKKTGMAFIANFTIIDSGNMELGFVVDNPADPDSQFQMGNNAGDDLTETAAATIDYSAIANLSVAGDEPEGPAIPEGAPFTAVTTDAGPMTDVRKAEYDLAGANDMIGEFEAPLYIISIPQNAKTIFVTLDASNDELCWQSSNKYGFTGVAAVIANVDEGTDSDSTTLAKTENEAGKVVLTIPVPLSNDPWWGDSKDYEIVREYEDDPVYAVAPQKNDTGNPPLCFFTFEYGTASEDGEDTYAITINQPIGGTVSVMDANMIEITKAAAGDLIYLANDPEAGYRFKHYLINGVAVTEAELGMANGFYTMPGEAVIISAVFEALHTCSYDREVADETYYVSEATCEHGATYYKSCECGQAGTDTFYSGETVGHVYENGACKWCGAAEPVQTPGYRFATSADVSAENGRTAVVSVKITGHSDENVTGYNAYDVTLTFDTDKLELATDEEGNYIYSGAVKSDNGSVTVSGNTIRIVGCGADKAFGTEIAALTFKTKAEGNANVTISKVQVSDKEESVKEDAPEATPKHDEDDTTADTTPDESVILVPFSVTKPDFVSGNDTVLTGKDYTFSFTGTDNYTYSELKVTVGGVEVTPSEADGVYTIENVTGAIVIEAVQTAKSYDVDKPENVSGPEQATFGTDYIFTVTPDEGKEIESVKATIGGEEIAVTINNDGAYVIAGGSITGPITITVTQKDVEVPETKYTNISFSGIAEAEIEGGLTQKAEAGKDFTFQLKPIEGYIYVVKVNGEELTANEDGTYTIPAVKMIEGDLTVFIEKTEIINVKVAEYIKLDGKSMFLITAKSAVEDSTSVLKYGNDVMYTSTMYDAYSWLVISTDSAEVVQATAETAITIAEAGTTAPAVAYGYDVNGTTKVDVNDAQLVYDMYNASYNAFTENLTVKKFLEADTDGSMNLGTKDVATIINYIVNQNA